MLTYTSQFVNRAILFLCLEIAFVASAAYPAKAGTDSVLDKKITVILTQVTIPRALQAIGEQAGCSVSYSNTKVNVGGKVNINYVNVTVLEALSRLLGHLVKRVHVSQNTIFIQMHSKGIGVLSGMVTTQDSKPAPYTNIIVRENGRGALTDESGYFQIKGLKQGVYSLRASSLGLLAQEKLVWVSEQQPNYTEFALAEDASQLNEVLVTTSYTSYKPVSIGKAYLRHLDLPQSSAVVSSVVINDQQITHLGEALRNVSGVSLTQQRGGVNETFSSRGYSIGIAGASGSIFKNGVISNTQGFPETSTLESVEVLKGSASLLYGNVSGGLVVNMITKKPRFDSGGEVAMRIGSHGFYKPMLDLFGPIAKNLAFRVASTYETGKSYRDVVATRRAFVNPSLLYKLGDRTVILLQGDYSLQELTPDNGIGSLNANRPAEIVPSRSRYINTSWAFCDIDQVSGSLTVNHKFNSAWKMNFIAAMQTTNVSSFSTNVPNAIEADGTYARGLSRAKTSENSVTGQLNINGNFKTGKIVHQLLVGTEYIRLESASHTFNITSHGAPVSVYDTINILNMDRYSPRNDIPDASPATRTTSPSHRVGLYGQDMISLTEKIKVLGGVRWSYQRTIQTTLLNLTDKSESRGGAATLASSAFSPKASLIYQPIKTVSLYGSYSNNFIINNGIDINGAQLKPSIVNQLEIGSKNEVLGGKLSINASVYKIINHSMAQMAPFKMDGTVNSDVNVKELTGQTVSDGFEIDLIGNLSDNWYFIAGYGYNYMRYTKTSKLKGSYIEGERLINNPDQTVNGTMYYTFENGICKGLKVGVSGFYTGKRFGGLNNTYGQNPDFSRLLPLTGFATFDVSAGYRLGAFSALIKISNIFNKLNYIAHDRYSLNPIPPRQFAATLSYKFDRRKSEGKFQ